MKKNNLFVLIISLIVSIVILEAGLRLFTQFPVTHSSNKVKHKKLGHVMDSKMKEIDEHGFRNRILPSIDIVTLGDSHTYGFNASSDHSWPKLLGRLLKKNVYNFGVGGYGILQYQYLLSKSIELEPEAIFLALYIPNDLNDICRPGLSKQYWESRGKDFQINFDLCPKAKKSRLTRKRTTNKIKEDGLLWEWLNENSAAISILSEYYSHQSMIKKIEDGEIANGVVINDEKIKTVIAFSRIKAHAKYMDMDSPHIRMAYQVLKSFLSEAKKTTEYKNIRLAVLFIPSKERVFYNYLAKMGYIIPEEYMELVDNEDALKKNISSFLDNDQIPYIDVLPDMENALLNYGNVYPIEDDGHPLEIGYQIYADNAAKLYRHYLK